MVERRLLTVFLAGWMVIPALSRAEEKSPETSKKSETGQKGGDKNTTSEKGAPKEGAKEKTSQETPKRDVPAAGNSEAAPPSATPAPPPTASKEDKAKTGTYTVRLRDLEDRINRLKEQIFRTKARLSLLAESVLDRKIAGAKTRIVFKNEMGGSFRLVKAVFLLDGGPIYNKADEEGSLSERDEINVFDGPVMPGEHTLSVVLHYRGHGYGIFSYLRGYSFKTRSSRTFSINEGKMLKLDVVGYEKGTATTPLEERPDIRYVMDVVDFEKDGLEEQGGEEKE
jgi:hypothetical protein